MSSRDQLTAWGCAWISSTGATSQRIRNGFADPFNDSAMLRPPDSPAQARTAAHHFRLGSPTFAPTHVGSQTKYRGARIRTGDLADPNGARYQAAPRPDAELSIPHTPGQSGRDLAVSPEASGPRRESGVESRGQEQGEPGQEYQ